MYDVFCVPDHDSWPDEALKQEVNVMDDGAAKHEEMEKTVNPRLPDLLTDEHVYIHSDPDVVSYTIREPPFDLCGYGVCWCDMMF